MRCVFLLDLGNFFASMLRFTTKAAGGSVSLFSPPVEFSRQEYWSGSVYLNKNVNPLGLERDRKREIEQAKGSWIVAKGIILQMKNHHLISWISEQLILSC